jgi:hypothetical protein
MISFRRGRQRDHVKVWPGACASSHTKSKASSVIGPKDHVLLVWGGQPMELIKLGRSDSA